MNYNIKVLAVSIILPFLAGALGNAFTMNAIDTWHLTLNKPVFNPPNWVFGPVWTLLYLLMGISLYLVLQTKPKKNNYKKTGIILFGLQLILNSLWSIIFFGAKDPGLALFTLILLLTLIATTYYYFRKINKRAANLLIPYLLWVTFAGVLNASIVILN